MSLKKGLACSFYILSLMSVQLMAADSNNTGTTGNGQGNGVYDDQSSNPNGQVAMRGGRGGGGSVRVGGFEGGGRFGGIEDGNRGDWGGRGDWGRGHGNWDDNRWNNDHNNNWYGGWGAGVGTYPYGYYGSYPYNSTDSNYDSAYPYYNGYYQEGYGY